MKFTLYDKVCKLCDQKGVSLYKMCNDIGVTSPIITNWRNRVTAEPSLRVAILMADYFGVDPREFLN